MLPAIDPSSRSVRPWCDKRWLCTSNTVDRATACRQSHRRAWPPFSAVSGERIGEAMDGRDVRNIGEREWTALHRRPARPALTRDKGAETVISHTEQGGRCHGSTLNVDAREDARLRDAAVATLWHTVAHPG